MEDNQTIDAESLGAALAKHLAPLVSAVREQSAPRVQERDEYQETLEEVLKSSEDGTLKADQIMKLLDKHGDKMDKATTKKLQGTMLGERANRAKSFIDQELDKYAENDELIGFMKDQLRISVIKEFDTSDEYKPERYEMLERDVDSSTLRKLVKKHIERAEKAAEKKRDAGATGITKTGANTTQGKQNENTSSVDSLTPGQRELYQSHKNLLIRGGHKPEEAEKSAMSAALKRKA